LVLRRARPLLASAFRLPTAGEVDARLLGGAVLFGVGWGLAGLCPGPALTSLASSEPGALIFIAAMVFGTGMVDLGNHHRRSWPRRSSSTVATPAGTSLALISVSSVRVYMAGSRGGGAQCSEGRTP
jgi:hypothetical protein